MRLTVITPPDLLLTVAEAKAHLRVESGDDDGAIEGYIAAAQGQIDGPDGWLGRAIGLQTLELQDPDLCGAGVADPCAWIRLPCPPVTSIVSVTYGSGTAVDPGAYVFGPGDVVRPYVGLSWPWSWSDGPSVKIRYQAGYGRPDGDGVLQQATPAPIRAALLLMTAELYETRGGLADAKLAENPAIARLLAPYRVFAP